MVIATVEVSGTVVRTSVLQRIPKGIIGAKVAITYTDDTWKDLNVTAVFRSHTTRDVTNISDTVIIPQEVVSKSGKHLYLGLYGVTEDGSVAIPTFWLKLGMISDAADPCGDESTDPGLPMWAQLERRIDILLEGSMPRLVEESVMAMKKNVINEILTMYPAAEEATF